jgi:hypothetical protein
VTATDAVGNTSAASTISAIVVDTVAPLAPGALAVVNVETLVTGTAEAGSTVTITTSGGTVLGTATVDGSGHFSVTLSPAQTNGETLTAYATDKAGNLGSRQHHRAVYHPAKCAGDCHRERRCRHPERHAV